MISITCFRKIRKKNRLGQKENTVSKLSSSGYDLGCEHTLSSHGWSKEKAGKKGERRDGKETRGEFVDKGLKLPFSPINLPLICRQHVLISGSIHWNVNRPYATIPFGGKYALFWILIHEGEALPYKTDGGA